MKMMPGLTFLKGLGSGLATVSGNSGSFSGGASDFGASMEAGATGFFASNEGTGKIASVSSGRGLAENTLFAGKVAAG